MASKNYRRRPDVERKFVRLELLKGWLSAAGQAVAILLSAGFGFTAITEAHAADFQATAGRGIASLAFASIVMAVGGRRDKGGHG
jgi:hypothetical protein